MTMAGASKMNVTCAEEDIISNLPEHLIDLILERVPFEDAVRTSILSKKWRYRWTTMKSLVFNEHFTKKLIKKGAFGLNGFIRVITRILIVHEGPISKFVLHIPDMNLDSFLEVDQWMLLLSRKGVTEIVLTNSNQRYEIPIYVFSCLKLTNLNLSNCFFKPPLEFEGYLNLGELFCRDVDFGANVCGTRVNLPQLKKLSLYECTNLCNFNIKAATLGTLVVVYCPDAMLLVRLLDSPILATLIVCGISSQKLAEDLGQAKTTNMPTILCNFPRITTLVFDSHLLKDFTVEKIPKGPLQGFETLTCLGLHGFQPSDLAQLHGVLYLLQNSPNLKRLWIMQSEMKLQVINHDDGPASNVLRSPNCLDGTLNSLKILKIECSEGSQPELLFIKLLLARSPSLEKLAVTPSGSSDAQSRHKFAKDLMRFPRASPKAELIYLDSESHPKKLCFSFSSP